MITESVLLTATITLVALGLAATGFVMIHAALTAANGRRIARPLAHGRLVIAAALSSNTAPLEDGMELLRRLPRGRVVSLVSELTRSLSDEEDETIRSVAQDLGITDRAVDLCGRRRWWCRLEGTRLLELFDDARYLRPTLLADRHPLVRAQAAEWSARDATTDEIALLVGLLGDSDGLARHSAKDALIRLGEAAVPQVADELGRTSGRAALAPLEVAASINDARLLPGALRLSADDEPPCRALSTRLLGAIGGVEALDRLAVLLGDPDDQVRAEAAHALGLLSHWPQGPELAARLEDPSWDVRRQAGLALGSIGAPGRLLLRRARGSSDPFAADMAHQVLDLLAMQELVVT
jgi:hypothetical protein